jgi:hypothetical protein
MNKVTKYAMAGKVGDSYKYAIVRDEDGFFWGIPVDCIDESGRVTKEINGLQGFRSATMGACIQLVNNQVELTELIQQGIEKEVALFMVTLNLTKEQAERFVSGTAKVGVA